MGITGLWKLLAPAGKDINFTQYVVERYISGGAQRLIVIGIDASIWISQLQYPSHAVGTHSQHGDSPELCNFFFRLAHLLQLPVAPLFVFDGPERPEQKRGVIVRKKPHWLTRRFCELIEIYGFDHHTAPAEAEAELALLNKAGIVDVVLTEDSDALLFGAHTVIRGAGKVKDAATLFAMDNIKNHPDVRLDRGGLYLIALLCGCDYQAGLKGCASNIAHKLALAGFGTQLEEIIENLGNDSYKHLAIKMFSHMKMELTVDHEGILGRRYPSLSRNLNDDAPDVRVLDQFARPTVTDLPIAAEHMLSQLGKGNLDIPRLSKLAHHRFGWDDPAKLAAKFKTHIWPGLVFRAMIAPLDDETSARILNTLGLRPLRVRDIPVARQRAGPVPRVVVTANISYMRRLLFQSESASSTLNQSHATANVTVLACAVDSFFRIGNNLAHGPLLPGFALRASQAQDNSKAGSSRELLDYDFDLDADLDLDGV